MFEFMLIRIMMEEVSNFLDEIINDIQEGELEGLQAKIAVDDVIETAYRTRKGILAIIERESSRGMTDEELKTSKEFINWAGDIIAKCHVAYELLGDVELNFELEPDLEDSPFNFDFGFNREEDYKDCDSCEVKDLCEIFNKMDIFE